MAAAVEKIKISLEFSDSGAAAVVKKLESSFRGLTNAATQLDAQGISKVRDRIKNFDTVGKRNISTIQSQIGALKALRNEAQIGSSQFKQLTADIAKYSQELQKAEGRKRTGGRLVGAAKSVGAVAAAGVFGGPEGAIGAGIGALAGGPVGAAVGGAVGAQVGQIRQALGATAEYSANLIKLRIALKGVTTSQQEYDQSLQFIEETSKRFAIPQEIITKQFTRLQASVQGAGGNIEDTKTAFNGIVASVRATGGSLEDVSSALVATSQVFSKGKVSAEELRQQIGERLPGAFTLFASSIGKTPQELDKALERGEVSLADFQKFAEEIFKKYGLTAEIIAKSPEAAGDRLAVALSNMNESVGRLLTPIGSAFQEVFGAIIQSIADAADALDRFLGISDQSRLDLLNKNITKGNLRLAELNADIAREQRARPAADLLGGAGAAGGGASSLIFERDQLARQLQQMSQEQTSLLAMRKLRGDIKQARPGTGLPGAGDLQTTTKGPKGPKDITEAVANAQIAALRNRERGITLTKEMIEKEAELARIAAEALPPQKQRVRLAEIEVRSANQINQLEQQQLKAANSVTKAKLELSKLLTKAKGESGMFTDEQLRQAENQIRLNELMLKFNILVEDGVLSAEELRKKLEEALEALNKPGKEGMEKFKDRFKKGIESMGDLFGNLGDAAAQAFDGLGDKFHEFVTTGKADFKEFARSVLSDLSKIFIKAAMFNILKGLPGMSFLGSAKGNAFSSNGVVPFAKGGIVSKPTMFQYADGASGSFGLMGEAGAEAIMPLKRGPSGRLGVEVNNQGSARDAMNRYSRRSAGAAGGGMASEDEAIAAVQGSSAPIDVRFNVERINNVDYVTADQFQAGLQRAAQQGAAEGERRAMGSLRNSAATRRRIGI
jgi:lambda family phage tail tape measure protein